MTQQTPLSRDEAILAGLRASGVPPQAIKTTLEREGAGDIRRMVLDKTFCDKRNPLGLFVYPARMAELTRARLLFALTAKEMYLTGSRVQVVPVSTFLARDDDPLAQEDFERAYEAQAVFISEFFEKDTPAPFNAEAVARIRHWIRRRVTAGVSVFYLSDVPLKNTTPWWAESFQAFVTQHTQPYEVKAQQ